MKEQKKCVPEIRFAGFTDDWEQRKLGECFAERTERSAIGELISVTMNSGVVKASSLERKDNSSKNKENYKKVEKNDIAYNSMRMWQGASGVSEYSGILSPAYTVLIPQQGVNSIFFSYYFKLDKMLNVFQANSQGLTSDTWNLKYPVLKNILVTIPSLEEQTVIGNFFKQLDDTIALHQRTLEKYQKLKISYLEKMFPKENEQFPELRFPNFTDAWEQRKLGEISDKVIDKNIKVIYSETFTNSAEFGVISQRDFFDKDISNSDNLSNYYVVQNNDFIYNPRISNFAPVGPIRRNKLGRTGVMSPLYYVFRVRDVQYEFLDAFFETDKWHSFMKLYGDMGARADRISIKDSIFAGMPLMLPSLEEQTAIGNFFKQLDDTIALHQREVEKYKKIKQAYLEKMFI